MERKYKRWRDSFCGSSLTIALNMSSSLGVVQRKGIVLFSTRIPSGTPPHLRRNFNASLVKNLEIALLGFHRSSLTATFPSLCIFQGQRQFKLFIVVQHTMNWSLGYLQEDFPSWRWEFCGDFTGIESNKSVGQNYLQLEVRRGFWLSLRKEKRENNCGEIRVRDWR